MENLSARRAGSGVLVHQPPGSTLAAFACWGQGRRRGFVVSGRDAQCGSAPGVSRAFGSPSSQHRAPPVAGSSALGTGLGPLLAPKGQCPLCQLLDGCCFLFCFLWWESRVPWEPFGLLMPVLPHLRLSCWFVFACHLDLCHTGSSAVFSNTIQYLGTQQLYVEGSCHLGNKPGSFRFLQCLFSTDWAATQQTADESPATVPAALSQPQLVWKSCWNSSGCPGKRSPDPLPWTLLLTCTLSPSWELLPLMSTKEQAACAQRFLHTAQMSAVPHKTRFLFPIAQPL